MEILRKSLIQTTGDQMKNIKILVNSGGTSSGLSVIPEESKIIENSRNAPSLHQSIDVNNNCLT